MSFGTIIALFFGALIGINLGAQIQYRECRIQIEKLKQASALSGSQQALFWRDEALEALKRIR